jgi:DNA (cytosine-5)-methyltransferase 1
VDINHPFIQSLISKAAQFDNIVIDGFCGVGGVTEGFMKTGTFFVIACINHWDKAILSHQLKHPDCLHISEDFRTADLRLLSAIIWEIRKQNPAVTIHGWFSLECTNFSNAKGGMSRDADSRTLAEHLDQYILILEPDVIWIENVKEFLLWGPMIPKVKKDSSGFEYCPLVVNKKKQTVEPWMIPDPERKGEDFKRWQAEVHSWGYGSEWRLLNCADYGIPQHRVRLIMQFNKAGVFTWPVPTHNKKGVNGLAKWLPIKDQLDLTDEGESVLNYKKHKTGLLIPRIKSEKTVDRLIRGCIKHVLKGDNTWLVKFFSSNNNTSVNSGATINEPSPALTAQGRMMLATAQMISLYYSSGQQDSSVENPSPVVPTKDRMALITAQYVMNTQFDRVGHSLEETALTITANRKHYYLISAQYNNPAKSIEEPSATILARMDKIPPYLVVTEFGQLAIEVYPYDPPHIVKLKRFMAHYGIVCIKMRMLKREELLRIMTMDEKTAFVGTKADSKKMIGNAVPPKLVTALATAYQESKPNYEQRVA